VNHSMSPYPPLSKVAMACGNSVDAINTGTALGDLWLWSGDDWSQVSGSIFPASEAASLVFDSNSSTLLHHAGAIRTGTTTTALNGLTSWQHVGGVATLTPLGVRYQHGAIWHNGLKLRTHDHRRRRGYLRVDGQFLDQCYLPKLRL
jgi:hypothetical protein